MPFLPLSNILSLRKELEGTAAEIVTWGSDGYGDGVKQWSDTCDEQVGAVVRVTSAGEAAAVVRFAACHKIPFAVKGGGYSTSGASTTRGGIVLDLFYLRRVQVDPVSQVLIAEGGALWEDIDIAAAQHKLAVVGSTLNHIGAAGATLGGGYGWLTGQYGLAIDNLLWAKMILADGSVVTASEEQHPDLFWAIRGAGQSFGVAIELGFQAHKQNHPVFAGTLLFSADKLPKIVDFVNQFETLTDSKQGFWFGFTASPSMGECSILVVIFYNGNQTDAEQFFSPVLSLDPVVNEAQMLPYDSLNGILNAMDTKSRRRSSEGSDITFPVDEIVGPRKSLRGSNITVPLDPDFVLSIYHEFDGILRDFPLARDSILLFELLPNSQVAKVHNNATAFASRGPYYNVSSLFRWHNPRLDEQIHSLQTDLMDRIGTRAGIRVRPDYNITRHGTGVYANYAGNDLPNDEIFGHNLARLQALKKKYDPDNMFRKWHNITAPIDIPG
ncbi:hypothetical protein N7499_005434 [Penicillium canescens]|uniref:uncharacterized protein n=1 Tax=Penicillium canescens TaxID=5083 RepID=UPI0026E0AC01|nr:uncharacterized protein N7446_010895 [Penicillium canescens]KAJ6029755.1 hypothetical protein N7444_012742 [Penicillium canescens]KAJ6048212.1 hypothetical protein N7446_010895 [Penicillium canescens]KAJ6085805.1 hypothetical protein N7499_005434 [Penicillium canescens]KAJ6162577.1 hypothetical protein N7485_010807 [Penicillium canescens]